MFNKFKRDQVQAEIDSRKVEKKNDAFNKTSQRVNKERSEAWFNNNNELTGFQESKFTRYWCLDDDW